MSVSTVSRVFNGYDDVSPATRERVMDVARRLDYAPSAAARTLVKQQSQLIGVVLFTGYEHPDIHHPFFQEVLVGLKHGIGELGYDLLLFATEQPGSSRGRPHSYLRRARQHRVDGLVVMGVDRNDPEVEKLVRADIPVMAVDLDVVHDHTSFVASDNIGGARLAVRHLHELGHTRIAAIAGPSNTKPGADRTLGFRAEMRELGLKIPRGFEVEGDFYPESGERAMQSLLRLSEPPTAVFAAADMMAVGAIRTMHAAGLSVPGDLAIVGFDDSPASSLVWPPLTTMRQPTLAMARTAVDLLIGTPTVQGTPGSRTSSPMQRVLPHELVVRDSTAAPARQARRAPRM